MKRPLHIGMIGCGAQGQIHLRILRELGPEMAVVRVVCDLREECLIQARALWPEARYEQDYRDALASGDLDLVIVVTMPNTHATLCLAAFEAGAHVLCEKPFAMNLEEAEAILEGAVRAGKQIQLGTNMRYMPRPQYLRGLVESGEVGEPVFCKVQGSHERPPTLGPHYRLAMSGGGVLASTVIHALDLAMWVGLAPNPVSVSAASRRLFPGKRGRMVSEEIRKNYDAEDLIVGLVRFGDGATYVLEGNWCDDVPDLHGFEMVTTRATLKSVPFSVAVDMEGKVVDKTPAIEEDNWSASIRAQDEDVIQRLGEGRLLEMQDHRQLRNLQKLIDGCYESAHTGREVVF